MQLNLLVDVSVGAVATRWLKDNYSNVAAVRDVDPRMTDDAILAWAVHEERFIITMDKDFGELVFKKQNPHQGVLLLRLETETGSNKIKVLSQILTNFEEEMAKKFCVYQNGRLRINS